MTTVLDDRQADIIAFLGYARAGDEQEIARLLDDGIPADSSVEFGRTAMHEAAAYGHLDVLQHLLDAGADVNAACEDGWTPLCEAARANQASAVRFLLDQGARADVPTSWTAFNEALKAKADDTVFVALLSKLAPHTRTDHGRSLLEGAVLKNHLGAVIALFDVGAADSMDDASSKHLLELALKEADETVALEVLERARNALSETSLSQLLAMKEARASAPVTQLLLRSGADPLRPGDGDSSALAEACRDGDLRELTLLVQDLEVPSEVYGWVIEGANRAVALAEDEFYRSQQGQGPRPLHRWDPDPRKALIPYLGLVAYLEQHCALVPSVDLLVLAILGDELSLFEEMLQAGVDPDLTDRLGRLPLVEAMARKWGRPFMRALLDAGASANARDNSGYSPLLAAVEVDEGMYRDETNAIQILLGHGADPNLADSKGRTPLRLARSQSKSRIADVLLHAGVTPE